MPLKSVNKSIKHQFIFTYQANYILIRPFVLVLKNIRRLITKKLHLFNTDIYFLNVILFFVNALNSTGKNYMEDYALNI